MRRGARFGYCFPVAGLRVENERDRARVVAGLIAAPLVATLVAYVGFPIVHWSGEPLYGRSTYSSDAPLAFASGIAIVAIFAVIVFAAPALWWNVFVILVACVPLLEGRGLTKPLLAPWPVRRERRSSATASSSSTTAARA